MRLWRSSGSSRRGRWSRHGCCHLEEGMSTTNTHYKFTIRHRAHFETANYKLAEASFKAALALDPLCTEAIDMYSTTVECHLSSLTKYRGVVAVAPQERFRACAAIPGCNSRQPTLPTGEKPLVGLLLYTLNQWYQLARLIIIRGDNGRYLSGYIYI